MDANNILLSEDKSIAYINKSYYSKLSLEEQIKLVSEKTKQGCSVQLCTIPYFNIRNIRNIVESYLENPVLTSSLITNSIPVEDSSDKKTLEQFKEALLNLSESYTNLLNIQKDTYDYAEIPSNFEFDKKFVILKSRVRTKNNPDHFLTTEDFKKLFDVAFVHWTSGSKETVHIPRVSFVSHSFYREVDITDKSIRIGCQRYSRFEMEQIAVKLGFKGQKFGLTPALKRG